MIADVSVCLSRLAEALVLLAAPAGLQHDWCERCSLPEDELALNFDDVYQTVWMVDEQRPGLLTVEVKALLDGIDRALTAMSGPEHAEVWTCEGLMSDARWERVRVLARRAVAAPTARTAAC
ncbi:hypothetical protein IMZ11_06570 [Microtetraspora sp. AC03309]|uniref:hypothetical protein n=1 Tax=Microtetraspora sp. AC03309 TaxID=2779376 RepID=UPI001E56781D|nr:hypothetical protein [Microtetraspora sp. AC03309]MCC5575305.1 hypothetical protein [Microtetraspora sp. AC03309]